MKIVGLTGGIGSGKSTIANAFRELGIPIYIADIEAKKLSNRSLFIRKKLIALLGSKAYTEKGLNRPYVAQKIFNDAHLLQQVNAIIHPRVGQHFKRWVVKQKAAYCIKEAAILFENGSYKNCNATILVTAPKELRMERIMQRDQVSKEDVMARMQHQWEDSKKRPLATFIIENIVLEKTLEQVHTIHQKILNI